ncbi:Zinc (Zn2+)-Iron (Fe2+) Permease (ZIP) Family [Trachipleistophora hominis]|uniref:Zinc (Zn2+)-Iron (Fe2+) Permease (ZIP) Family n=1 Tax=Trachipleistophora hominis TaxID=72359 RepID=L7JVV7_TRAHO|nr:Zinc (Zn2+)-Iron (Fe2+) Permease (ZIP) Family [Trachipleistophora hominis]
MVCNTALLLLSAFVFVFTLLFSFSYALFKNTKLSLYSKCFSGGVLLSTIIFHIFPDVYTRENCFIAPFSAGISFLILFSIDKLYLQYRESHGNTFTKLNNRLQALVFICALSVHSFMEGLGTSVKTGTSLVWYAIGLLGHKWIEAFVVSVTMHTSGFSQLETILLLVFYSVLTPLGTVLGMIMMSSARFPSQTAELLNGVACGSFFYIGFIEMLNSEFESHTLLRKRDQRKIAAVFAGFFTMTSIALALSSMVEN